MPTTATHHPEPSDEPLANEVALLRERNSVLELQLAQQLEFMHAAQKDALAAARVKTEFLAVMSHELRTPLNAIIGYDDLLDQQVGGSTTPTQKVYIDRIRAGAEHLMLLIDQILSLARINAGDTDLSLESVDVIAMVQESVDRSAPIAAVRHVAIEAVALAPEVTCYTDASKLRQILHNLVANAVKFTMQGRITVSATSTANTLTIEVQDTGPGIETADLERIFDPFVQVDASATRRFGGTGIGLSVSRDFAHMLGGDLTVASQRGVGSIFTLCIPLRAFPYLHSATV